MSLLLHLKNCAERIPEPLGRILSRMPYVLRLGPEYCRSERRISEMSRLDARAVKARLLPKIREIVGFAYKNVPFYRDLYGAAGIRPDEIRTVDDFSRLPVVSKTDLQAVSIEARSTEHRGRMRLNTGGTSGQPLVFYVDRHAFAREWAHMHCIWRALFYKPSSLKLTFRGRNLGKRAVGYNAVHNEFHVNAYVPWEDTLKAIARITASRTIEFLHGYPSLISEFARECQERAPLISGQLRRSLKGVLLGSEFPAPPYRASIERAFGAPTISWYGHSEQTILAYETAPYVYSPFFSYGYAEAVKGEHGCWHLVGTSLDNRASPFVRYDTGDLIIPTFEEGLLKYFLIAEGRVGEFVRDAHGKRVGLTALVFGRHHPAFEWARFVQIRQYAPGEAVIIVTADDKTVAKNAPLASQFDFSGVAMHFKFEVVRQPVRTPSGKMPLLVLPGNA